MQKQVVATFANAAARDAAIPSPSAGMMCWLNDLSRLQVYTGVGWREIVASSGGVYHGTATADSGDVGNVPFAMPYLTVTLTLDVACMIKLSYNVTVAKGGTGDYVSCTVRDNDVEVGGTWTTQPLGSVFTHSLSIVRNATAGYHGFQVYMMCYSGVCHIQAQPSKPSQLFVEVMPN